MDNKFRINEIDAFRGLAALSVVLYHYSTLYQVTYHHIKAPYLFNFKYGYFGVQLFFIISGFVIYMTLEKSVNVKDFLIKRAARLYPAYIFAVILTFSVVNLFAFSSIKKIPFSHAIINLSMIEVFIPNIVQVDGVYWSLGVEVTFYILMAVLLWLGLSKKIEVISILWLVFSATVRTINLFVNNKILFLISHLSLTSYCHLLIAGIMFYKIRENGKLKHHFILAGCLLYELVFLNQVSHIFIVCFFALFYAVIYNKLKILNSKPLIFFGTISYSLYLIHQNIGYIIIHSLEQHGFVNEFYLIVPISISIALAILMTYYVEKPIQNVLRKAIKSRKAHQTMQKAVS